MLPAEKNDALTRVGPGTPMGEVLRRHWHPIAGVDELQRQAVKPVRLLGEDLVLFRDQGGRHGLLDRACAHRRADLSHGYAEERGIRCSYHGWQFDHEGRCLSQPYEDQVDPEGRLRQRVRLTAYEVRAKAGLLWAYLGPQPAPELPGVNQDIVAWVGQGRIADRTRETLGASDRGVAMLRRRLLQDIEAVQAGRDPKGVLRDPAANRRVFLPSDSREFFLHGLPLAEYRQHPKWARLLHHFIFHAGQPDWVQQAHRAATGVDIRPMQVLDL